MSLTQAQTQFAAEFITLMVSASALALVLLRPPNRTGPLRWLLRFLSAAGLTTVAVAAFLHGALLVTSAHGLRALGVIRVAGAVPLLAVLPSWWGDRGWYRPGPWLLRVGLVLWVGAGAAELGQASPWLVDAMLVAGALVVGLALLSLTRKSIALRVAASGGVGLLLVVLVLSLSLSAVISSSVQKDGLNRLSARMSTEQNQAVQATTSAVGTIAKLVGGNLAGPPPNPLVEKLASETVSGPDASQFQAGLANFDQLLANLRQNTFLAYSTAGRVLIVPSRTIPAAVARAFAGDRSLAPPSCAAGAQGLYVEAGELWAAASYPVCSTGGQAWGTLLVGEPLDSTYLKTRLAVDPSTSLILLSGSTVIASAGAPPPAKVLTQAAALDRFSGQAVTDAVGNQYVSVAPLPVVTPVKVRMVLATPATSVLSARSRLDRTLFLIALGGTLLALGLAIFTGDRITAGLRRLTGVAASIQGGETNMRAEMPGDDEVAALGTAFDSMLDAVSAQAAALQTAADDETKLRNRMEAVVAGMSDALVAVDQFGRITDFNRAAEELIGVRARRAIGSNAAALVRITGDDGVPLAPRLFQMSEHPRTAFGELQHPGGARIPVAVSVGGLLGPADELVGSVLVFRDLRREQELERMKTEFLSRVGHELRTPLTGIMGYTEILLRREVPEDRTRLFHEEMLVSARRLLRIVEMLEFFASTGAGRMVLRPEPVDVRIVVSAIATSWADRKPDNISIRRRVARNVPPVLADPRWLNLAVDELVDNAVKFSPDGGPVLLEVSRADPPRTNGRAGKQMVEISVRDRGMGMTAAEYQTIFGDFVQADSSDTRRFGGLGLGLSVVLRVVEGHGGEITCRSAPGKGTTFTIRIPAAPAPAVKGGEAGPDRRRSTTAPPVGS